LNLLVKNFGTKPAHNVRIVAELPRDFSIKEKTVASTSGPVANFNDLSSSDRLNISTQVLTPGEQVTASMLIDGPGEPVLQIGVRSDDSLGRKGEDASVADGNKNAKVAAFVSGAAVFGAQMALMSLFLWRRRNLFAGKADRANNTAFVLLHQGLLDEATKLLKSHIEADGGTPVSLSNYALALGLSGDVKGAEQRLAAAEWWAANNTERSLVEFNRAVLEANNGDYAAAESALKKALSLHRSIRRYADFSIWLKEAAKKSARIRAIVVGTKGSTA
jgi:tetratricopeptide (TPR) repeat protein